MADRFHCLKYGLAFVLSFIGVKMLLPLLAEGVIMVVGDDTHSAFLDFTHRFLSGEYKQEFINISLGVAAGAIFLSIILSLVLHPSGATEESKLFRSLDPDSDGN